jgi:signal transduction histidine kinase
LIQKAVGDDASASLSVVLNGAQTSLTRASRLSRQIADGGRGEQLRGAPVSITERLERLRDTILLVAGSTIVVEFLVDEEVPEVLCAAEALDDVLLNIIGNAVRAMPDGGHMALTVTCDTPSLGGAPSVVMRIGDTGCGMTAEIAARAFEPRFTTRPPGHGTGIGLAMVADFTRTAGGMVELETCVGVGTVVTLRLPSVPRHARATRIEPTGGR